MNERINKLFGQAMDQSIPETWTTLTHSQLSILKDKFAELIVRECIDCAVWVGKSNHNPVEPIHTAHAVKRRIEKHFGVEE